MLPGDVRGRPVNGGVRWPPPTDISKLRLRSFACAMQIGPTLPPPVLHVVREVMKPGRETVFNTIEEKPELVWPRTSRVRILISAPHRAWSTTPYLRLKQTDQTA
jgi:hypothetical protein